MHYKRCVQPAWLLGKGSLTLGSHQKPRFAQQTCPVVFPC
uniref:Uncharacterized protein n=1 Tax=Arundo donax TaxID=35708 RepID=A0A0A9AZ07_ARUDO